MNKKFLYESLINEMEHILTLANPCNIYQNENGKIICNGEFGVPCCHQACPMLTETGCKTQNIGCKIWLCSEAIAILKQNPVVFERWIELCGIVGKLHIKDKKYKSKEEILENMDVSLVSKLKHQFYILNKIFG